MGKRSKELISLALAKQRQLVPGLLDLALQSVESLPQMTALPPPGESAYPYGDIVPLSFLLIALESIPETMQTDQTQRAISRAKQIFQQHKHDSLWAFQSTALITSVDSAFVLRAVGETEGILALEQFSDGVGGYYPQLFTEGREKNRMTVDARTGHWCQADYSILCQVEALRRRAGMATDITANAKLMQGFPTRSGLFIANPYLMDWLLADALGAMYQSSTLADALASDVLTALIDSAGSRRYDRTFSTALALSSLVRLNRWSDQAEAALIELLDYQPSETPACIPFYSSMNMPWRNRSFWEIMALKMDDAAGQLVNIGDEEHRITFYQDTHHLISQSVVFIALSELSTCFSNEVNLIPARHNEAPHPRYQCSSHTDYIAQYALPPYVTHRSETYV